MFNLLFILLPSAITAWSNLDGHDCKHASSDRKTFDECTKRSDIDMMTVVKECKRSAGYKEPICFFDISSFNQEEVSKLLGQVRLIWPNLKCEKSALKELNFQELDNIGHNVLEENFQHSSNEPGMVITNNFHLKTIEFGRLFVHDPRVLRGILPGFWTIQNNPRLSRYSIDSINKIVEDRAKENFPDGDRQKVYPEKIKMQKYGECSFVELKPTKTSLSWEEFRWCRTVKHNVTLEGPNIQPGRDTAYIHNVEGCLRIKNTPIMNLTMLPVFFEVKSDCSEISGNKNLCISFEDEIRMKRLGFKMKNNKDLSCRTNCVGGNLTLLELKQLKDCVVLNGGLILDGVDEDAAGADLFKTVKTINGPVEIANVSATIDFRKLEKIIIEDEEQMYLTLVDCTHPILFPSLKDLSGPLNSKMVLLDKCRMDAYKFLKDRYGRSIEYIPRPFPPRPTTTTTTSSQAPTTDSVISSSKQSSANLVVHDSSDGTTPELVNKSQQNASDPSRKRHFPLYGNVTVVVDKAKETASEASNKKLLFIISAMSAAVALLSSVAILVLVHRYSFYSK